jgi:hypothetical protein
MPFCCRQPSAGTCVVLGSKQSRPPHHLGGAHRHGATYSSHRAPSTYALGKERVHWVKRLSWQVQGGRVRQRLGWTGVIDYASAFFEPAASPLRASSFPRNEGLLGPTPSVPRISLVCTYVVLLSILLLVCPIAISAAEKITAKVSVLDALTRPDRPVKLEARLIQQGLLARAGLGGEQFEYIVGGKKVGIAMTGGDGRAFFEYTPRMRGNLSMTVRVVESPRVNSAEGMGTLFSWERRRPILLVEVTSLREEPKTPIVPLIPLPPLPGGRTTPPISPSPAPDAAEELKRLTDFYFNVIYVTNHSETGESNDMREWLHTHGFPPGPIEVTRPGEGALTTMIERLRGDGWDNVKAGIGRTRDFAADLVAQRLDVVIIPGRDGEQLPKKAQAAKAWKDVRKKRL